MRNNMVMGAVKSEKGFYIGDICYVLSDDIYDEVWGGAGYEDGIYEVPENGFKFAVAGTAYGDGCYTDNNYRQYGVDAGVIGLVPKELVDKDMDGGNFFEGAGEAFFIANEGKFEIILPGGSRVHIDTADYAEEEE